MEERPLPDDEELEEVVAERITALLEARLRGRDNLEVERMQRFVPLARNLTQAEDELAVDCHAPGRLLPAITACPPVQLAPATEQPAPFSNSRNRRTKVSGRDHEIKKKGNTRNQCCSMGFVQLELSAPLFYWTMLFSCVTAPKELPVTPKPAKIAVVLGAGRL